MVNPEELRTGDLVRVSHDCMFPKGTMCVVADIHPDIKYKGGKGSACLSAINGDDDGPWWTWCSKIGGIPITPEILNKNGFKGEVVGKYYLYAKPLDNDACSLARYLVVERKGGVFTVAIKYHCLYEYALLREIQYVHELQHILWALGFDAELKL